MVDKRKFKRYLIRLKIIDQQTGELLGFAENINTQGMKIMSKKALPMQTEIPVWLVKEDADLKISLCIYRIWSSFSDSDPVFYYSGVHFINPSTEALDGIQTLMDTENKKLI